MKITMWMLANKLEKYEPFLHINEADEKTYRGSRLYRSENYMYICQQDENTIIYGEYPESYILLKNAFSSEVQDIVLTIFDMYNDWEEKISVFLDNSDYQNVADLCYVIFGNPIFMLGVNNKVIALNSQTSSNEIGNPEWDHLKTYGYSSVNNFTRFKSKIKEQESTFSTKPMLHQNPPTADRTNFVVTLLCTETTVYGRMTIMEYFHKFTPGDMYVIEFISKMISKQLSLTKDNYGIKGIENIISELIAKQPIAEEDIDTFFSYYVWNKDAHFRLLAIHNDESQNIDNDTIRLICEYADTNFPECPSTIYNGDIILLFNEDKRMYKDMLDIIKKSYVYKLNVRLGTSIQFRDWRNLNVYYKQALYSIKDGHNRNPNAKVFTFYKHAVNYLLTHNDLNEKISAIHPDVLSIYNKTRNINCEDLETLYTYLAYERSLLKASEVMHIHRNTLIYRIKKITDGLAYDIDDPYNREYLIISILFAKQYFRINKMTPSF